MNTLLQSTIDASIAALTQATAFPEAPFGYGSDLSCDTDLDATGAEVSGDSTLALAQAIVRRLDCPRGELPDDRDYGIGLRQYLNRGVTADDIRALGGQIRNELAKDDRIDDLRVTLRPNSTGSTIAVEILVRPFDRSVGTFSLTMSASDSALLLEEIRSVG